MKLDVVSDDFIVQKFMSENQWELRLGTQLVVNEGQEAMFLKGGVALDVFTAGTHTLVTGNIPLLRKLVNSVFGGNTPFTAEVWFINKTVKRNLKWGTPQRIPLLDPQFGFPINVGAFGQWGFRIDDSRSFVTQVVGAQLGADSAKIDEYFIGEIVEKLSQTVSTVIAGGVPLLQVNTKLTEISRSVTQAILPEFTRFGIELVNFSISNISIPPDEMKKIQDVMAKRMELQVLGSMPVGQGYLSAKSFEVMGEAAKNSGAVGGVMGVAAGMGLGLGAGLPMGQAMAQAVQPGIQPPASPPAAESPMVKLEMLKKMLDAGLLTAEEYAVKRAAIIDRL